MRTSDGSEHTGFPNGSNAREARCCEGENGDLDRDAKFAGLRSLSLDNRDCVGYLSRETDLDSCHKPMKILCRRLGSTRFRVKYPY
jgi:hypothetical protein